VVLIAVSGNQPLVNQVFNQERCNRPLDSRKRTERETCATPRDNR